MKTFVIYDIVEDKIRTKIFETCKDYGLNHVQYSTFFGELNHNRRQEITGKLKRIMKNDEGNIIICPVCDKDLRLMQVLEVLPDAGD
ncbi:MAG: CRISPR-associated protein Cas2 [Clostridia bacterium]|jgi:CRISPR-associated protein Cas2|nr:CRISPR-associated protein Cas2 [Clostridiales bacterium]MDK2986747.1 CRISPR-associated protein Cas2 [Clostridia bacterium]